MAGDPPPYSISAVERIRVVGGRLNMRKCIFKSDRRNCRSHAAGGGASEDSEAHAVAGSLPCKRIRIDPGALTLRSLPRVKGLDEEVDDASGICAGGHGASQDQTDLENAWRRWRLDGDVTAPIVTWSVLLLSTVHGLTPSVELY